jgi:hypothetical protein
LFGDGELLFVTDGRQDSRATEVLVFSAVDGALLGRRSIEPAQRRWVTCGRNVLSWEEKGSLVTLRLKDAWTGRELWSRQVAKGSRGDINDGEEVALMEPGGQFTIASLATGQVRFSVPLEAEPSLGWIQVIRSEKQYLLLASQDVSPGSGGRMGIQGTGASAQRGMHGRVYAFSRATGKLQWPMPAFVTEQWLPQEQPTESPLLMFVSLRQGNKNATELLALDRRTGGEVYQKELGNLITTHCDIVADAAKRTVTLGLSGQNSKIFTFLFTEQPRSPQPPFQSGEMASSSANKPAGEVDQSLGAAIEFFGRGVRPAGGIAQPARRNAAPR